MILGIVLEGAAFFCLMMYISLCDFYTSAFTSGFIFFAICFAGVGTPFLIIGIKRKNVANNKIRLLKSSDVNNNINMYGGGYYQPQQGAPYQPQQGVPYQPQQGTPYQPQGTQTFVDINWRKYNPLEAGISYKKDKDYKFAHMDGYCGSVPQKFMDRTFPCCPICCSKDPYWNIGQQAQMSWKGSLYLFKCSRCEGVISMSMPDVQTLRDGKSGIISNPNVGLVNLVAKASSGKEAGVVYAVIESVGNSGVTSECEGKEFKLEDLQDMYLRK